MGTKLHTSLVAPKALMLKIPIVIIKNQEPHLTRDFLYEYHLLIKGKHK